jgi:hypothetical protein
MNVKGTVFVTAKVNISAAFGEERWNSFMDRLSEKDDYFKKVIMSVTPIPLDKFTSFLDELAKEYFNNDNKQYLMFGKAAAKFALSPGGPYYSYVLSKDLKYIVEAIIPKLWSTYYDEGVLTARLFDNTIHVKISGIPIKHVYFEYLIAGYLQKGIKMLGKKAVESCVSGFSRGDSEIYYQYEVENA